MISTNQIKQIKALQQKKWRDSENCFVAETPKVVEEFLHCSSDIQEVFALSDWIDDHWRRFPKVKMTEVSHKELERISGLSTPNQVLAVIQKPQEQASPENFFQGWSIVLDRIQDPGNLGTIIRTADWFGFERIICSLESVESTNPKCIQATMGSWARVPIFYQDLSLLASQKPSDFPIYGSFLEGENIYHTLFPSQGWIVMGSEAHGIGEDHTQWITHRIHIPGFSQHKRPAESLNASIATAIFCSEIRRTL